MVKKNMTIFLVFSSLTFLSVVQKLQASHTDFQNLLSKSKNFEEEYRRFPVRKNTIELLGTTEEKQRVIVDQARNTHPIVDVEVLQLMQKFLDLKKEHGTSIEKELYHDMTIEQFITRLLTNRPFMFVERRDRYVLRNGSEGSGGFEFIGTAREKAPLLLKDYLSYDEMQLSALLGVAVPTYFINNGDRFNSGEPGLPGSFQEKGHYVGLVGARFEKRGVMEYQHMLMNKMQNTTEKGYGENNDSNKLLRLWSDFYGYPFMTYKEAEKTGFKDFVQTRDGNYLHKEIYKKRLKMSLRPFLLYAQSVGEEKGKKAYVHIVGLGLGVWQKSDSQQSLMLEVYKELLTELKLPAIDTLNFSWFHRALQSEIQELQKVANEQGIKVLFSKRNPADKLEGEDADKVLVAMYAWDGNAYPGNEYWVGALTASGDPAAASCSTIQELQNPLINDRVSGKYVEVYPKASVVSQAQTVSEQKEEKQSVEDSATDQDPKRSITESSIKTLKLLALELDVFRGLVDIDQNKVATKILYRILEKLHVLALTGNASDYEKVQELMTTFDFLGKLEKIGLKKVSTPFLQVIAFMNPEDYEAHKFVKLSDTIQQIESELDAFVASIVDSQNV